MGVRRVFVSLLVVILSILLSLYFREVPLPDPSRLIFESLRLHPGATQIRLLTLLPGEREHPVRCELSVNSLRDDPVYEALSYTWGDPAAALPIWLNGQTFDVTANLYGALVELRDKSETRTLWVDAICINQRDLIELGEQVQHMRAIYQQASEVLVWLGDAIEDSDFAMDLVAQFTNSNDGLYVSDDTEPDSPSNERARKSLGSLFNRPYWTRLWVIQEFAVSKSDPLIGCGGKWIRSGRLHDFLNQARTQFGYHRTRAIDVEDLEAVRNLMAFRRSLSKGMPLKLVQVLSQTRRTSSATRIHDVVYALLGLVDPDYGAGIAVDYLKPVEQLFIETAAQCISVDDSLNVMYGALGRGSLDLPSWVPDWSVDRPSSISYNKNEGTQRASADINTSARFSKDGKILTVDGLRIDIILNIHTIPGTDQQRFDSDIHRGATRVEEFVSSVAERHFASERHSEPRDWTLSEDVLVELAITNYNLGFVPLMEMYEERLRHFVLEHFHGLLHFNQRPFRSERGLRQEFEYAVWWTVADSHVFVTETGFVGVATGFIEAGDVLAVLFGGSMPFILRKVEHSEDRYKLVGYAIVHGLKNGEAIEAMEEQSQNVTRALFSII